MLSSEAHNENNLQKTNDVEKNIREKLLSGSIEKQNDFENESVAVKDTEDEKDIANTVIDNANKYFLVKILSPEITANENKKRKHKNALIKIVKVFLISQFALLTLLLLVTIGSVLVFHGIKNDLELSYVHAIMNFISAYIASVVIELIAMLKYIVSNVFDTSIAGLVEFYKDATNNKEEL